MTERQNDAHSVDDRNSNDSDNDRHNSDSSDSDAIDERLKAIVQKRLKEKGSCLKSANIKKIQRFLDNSKKRSKSNQGQKKSQQVNQKKKKKKCQRDQSPETLFPEDLRYKLIHNRNKAKKE